MDERSIWQRQQQQEGKSARSGSGRGYKRIRAVEDPAASVEYDGTSRASAGLENRANRVGRRRTWGNLSAQDRRLLSWEARVPVGRPGRKAEAHSARSSVMTVWLSRVGRFSAASLPPDPSVSARARAMQQPGPRASPTAPSSPFPLHMQILHVCVPHVSLYMHIFLYV